MGFDAEKIIPPGAKIKVIGIGGGGGNAVNTMIRSNLEGVEFIAANTDVQALRFALPDYKIQVGKELTKGLGAGADPDVGRDAALEDRHEIQEAIAGADMVFITAGMGGGTGTGGASVIAQIARDMGALTVAVVTKPFNFEGKRRRKHAELGIERLRECVDTLITIPNQRLLQIATPDLSMVDAFRMADEVLVNAVKGISDIINIPGTVNVDFADVKTVMSSMGLALMGIGRAVGENRAVEAARQAIRSPLLEDVDIEGATGILINITAGSNISLMEVNEACSIIQDAAHEDANIIFGAVIDESCGDEIRVTVIATGFPAEYEDGDDIPRDSLFGARRDNPYAAKMVPSRRPVARPRFHESRINFSQTQVSRPAPVEPRIEDQSDHFAAEDLAKLTFEPVSNHDTQLPLEVEVKPDAPQLPLSDVAHEDSVVASSAAVETFEYQAEQVDSTSVQDAPETMETKGINEVTPQDVTPSEESVDEELLAAQAHESVTQADLPEADISVELSQNVERSGATASAEEATIALREDEPLVTSAHFEEFDIDPAIDAKGELEDEDDDLISQGPPPMESYFSDAKSHFDQKIDEALELAERLKGLESDSLDESDDNLDIPAFLRESRKDLSLD